MDTLNQIHHPFSLSNQLYILWITGLMRYENLFKLLFLNFYINQLTYTVLFNYIDLYFLASQSWHLWILKNRKTEEEFSPLKKISHRIKLQKNILDACEE